MSRHVRVETRSRHQSDLRRVMHSTEKVRKWEKKWVRVEETSLQIFKWMPISKDEEQHQQQLLQQQQVAAFSSPQKSTQSNYSQKEFSLRDKKNLDGNDLSHRKPATILESAAPAGMLDSKLNGAGDANRTNASFSITSIDDQKPNEENSMIMMSTELNAATVLENSNKRQHPNDESNLDLTNSPQAKRLKASNNHETGKSNDLGNHMLASMQSVEVLGVKYDMMSSTKGSQQISEPGSHKQELGGATLGQHHVQPNIATSANNRIPIATKDATLATDSNSEAMETEDIAGDSLVMQNLSSGAITNAAITPFGDLEDFSSIARNVTEQIVLKVSNCYGGDC